MPKSNRKRKQKTRVVAATTPKFKVVDGYTHTTSENNDVEIQDVTYYNAPRHRGIMDTIKKNYSRAEIMKSPDTIDTIDRLDIHDSVNTGFGINNLPKFISETIEHPIRGNVEWVTIVDNPSDLFQLGIKLKDQNEQLIDFVHESFAAAAHQALYYASMVSFVEGERNSSVRYRDNNCRLILGYSIATKQVIYKDKPAPLMPMLIEVCRKLRDGVKD